MATDVKTSTNVRQYHQDLAVAGFLESLVVQTVSTSFLATSAPAHQDFSSEVVEPFVMMSTNV